MRTKPVCVLASKHLSISSVLTVRKHGCDTSVFLFGELDNDGCVMAVCNNDETGNKYLYKIDRVVVASYKDVLFPQFEVINAMRFLYCDCRSYPSLETCVSHLMNTIKQSHLKNEVLTLTYSQDCKFVTLHLDANNGIIGKEGF